MSNDSIHFISTGGTIDSEYDGALDTVVPKSESVIPRFVNSLRIERPTSYATVCMKDSRTLNDEDRVQIAQEIEDCDPDKIIVTHGTYTLPETAKYLQTHVRSKNKIVVLTGSMTPVDGFTMSDAGFNLGFAIAKVDELSPGVYICIGGQTLTPEEAVRLINEGRFVSTFFSSDKTS